MRKIKLWIINSVLPVWARQELQNENARLLRKVAEQDVKLKEQAAYIDGLEAGIRSQRKIVINTTEANK